LSYPEELKVWSEKLGESVEDLQTKFTEEVALVKKNHPEMTPEVVALRALKILYSKIKSDMRSRAEPFDFVPVGVTSKRDMNVRKKEDLLAKYANPDTREEALAGIDGIRIKVTINQVTGDETPIVVDDREWIEFQRDGKDAKFKNRSYGKELAETWVRDEIAIGKRANSNEGFRILRINSLKNQAEGYPKLGQSMRSRFTVRKEDELIVDLRSVEQTSWTNLIMIPGVKDATTEAGMYDLLGKLPDWLKTSLGSEELKDIHEKFKDDYSRVAMIEGDVTYIGHEANENGSFMIVFEDESNFDIESEGIQGYIPKELEPWIQFSPGTHVRALVRTGEGNVRDRDTGEFMKDTEGNNVKRIIFNVLGIAADPSMKIPYEPVVDETESVTQS
jgi:hypothetical protein